MKNLYLFLFTLVMIFMSVPAWGQTNGIYDVRFVVSSVNCSESLLYLDLEVKANDAANRFDMGDQNYKFTYNKGAISTPLVSQELGFSGALPHPDVVNYAGRNMPYNPHSTSASIEPTQGAIGLCILNITWQPGINGVIVPEGTWSPVSRIVFQIVDPTQTECLNLVWRDKSNPTNFTNITEVEPVPPPGSTQTAPYSTTVNVPEGLYQTTSSCLGGLCSASFPVEWLSFEADQVGDDAFLKWTVGSELNNESYRVQRSVDGHNFNEVATLKAVGTTSSNTSYEYVDPKISNLVSPSVYYRIKQVDTDGGYTFSSMVELSVINKSDISLIAYPNPTVDYIVIQYTSRFEGEMLLEMVNLEGKTVWNQSVDAKSGQLKVNTSDLASGTYLVRVSNEKSAETIKVIMR